MTQARPHSSDAHKAGHATVLLTILPQWAEAILRGEKQWEYRRAAPRTEVGARIVLYASGKERAIVGECRLAEVRRGPIGELAETTAQLTPHTPAEISAYFIGKSSGTALRVNGVRRYPTPIPLDRLRRADPSFQVPQNFVYLRGDTRTGAAIFNLLPPADTTVSERRQISLF